MKAGNFNVYDYIKKLEKLYEEKSDIDNKNGRVFNEEGLVIPDTNLKAYKWLKKEYDQKQVAVKVEIKGQGSNFKPGYYLQTNLDSVKDFKPTIFTSSNNSMSKDMSKNNEKTSKETKNKTNNIPIKKQKNIKTNNTQNNIKKIDLKTKKQ